MRRVRVMSTRIVGYQSSHPENCQQRLISKVQQVDIHRGLWLHSPPPLPSPPLLVWSLIRMNFIYIIKFIMYINFIPCYAHFLLDITFVCTGIKQKNTANTNGINQVYATICAHIILYNMLCRLNAKSRLDIIIKKITANDLYT